MVKMVTTDLVHSYSQETMWLELSRLSPSCQPGMPILSVYCPVEKPKGLWGQDQVHEAVPRAVFISIVTRIRW